MPDGFLEVEVAQRFFDGLVLGFLEGFLEFAVEDVFLLALGFPGIAEFIFTLLGLIGEDTRRVSDVNVGRGLDGRCVRKDHGETGIHRELRLAAGTHYLDRRRGLFRHACSLRQKGGRGTGFPGCGKIQYFVVPFTLNLHGEPRHAARRGISLLLGFNPREIPRFARNDRISFFRSLFATPQNLCRTGGSLIYWE